MLKSKNAKTYDRAMLANKAIIMRNILRKKRKKFKG